MVNPASSTLALTASPNPASQQQPVTLSAAITTSTGIAPTGSIQFLDGATPIGTVAIAGSGSTLVTGSLSVGNHPSGEETSISLYLDTSDVLGYARLESPKPVNPPARFPLAWAFLPAPLLLMTLARRRRIARLLATVVLAAAILPLTACSGMYPAATPPGTYVIQIHVVGKSSGIAHTLNIQVTVTK